MNRLILSILLMTLLFSPVRLSSSDKCNTITKSEIRSIIEFLGSDLLEGRAPGTRGGELAEEYIQSLFQLLDIAPLTDEGFYISKMADSPGAKLLIADSSAGDADIGKSYYQQFRLNGFSTQSLSTEVEGIDIVYLEDIVGSYVREKNEFSLTGDVVFAGFGIESDAWAWDDYKDVDVAGKIVIVRVNEPGRGRHVIDSQGTSELVHVDPNLFEGNDLTYYGRWTYKIEEAARRGAKGILLVHTTESAGYGWHVVRNSWGGEELYLDSALNNDLLFRGWIREEKLIEIFDSMNISLGELYEKSESRNFKPIDLGFQVKIEGKNDFRSFTTRNVVGYIPGNDPELRDKAVLLSAHIDHLGRNTLLEGDQIFNGAIDNGSAVASMMITAKHLKKHQDELRYSVIVLACEAEESGLLGSLYFAGTIDPSKIVANINFESTPVWEKSRDFVGVGAKYSTLEDILKKILQEEGLEYSYFSMSDRGFFYRSDQFSFARKGIPSVWLSAGEDFVSGRNRLKEFFLGKYHTVKDEYDPDWSLDSTVQTIGIALRLIDYINREAPRIEWKGRMTFPVDK
ncbi:MAG: M28 family peptidase [Bacteroidales bacterium]|nr:M28 family peptidase [Candidatus Latescibacterota bacterium]